MSLVIAAVKLFIIFLLNVIVTFELLTMSNNGKLSTAKCKTMIGAIFTRYFHTFQSDIFISHFSYHKPIVSFLEYNGMIESANNLNNVGINDEDDNNANNKNIIVKQGK